MEGFVYVPIRLARIGGTSELVAAIGYVNGGLVAGTVRLSAGEIGHKPAHCCHSRVIEIDVRVISRG